MAAGPVEETTGSVSFWGVIYIYTWIIMEETNRLFSYDHACYNTCYNKRINIV